MNDKYSTRFKESPLKTFFYLFSFILLREKVIISKIIIDYKY